MMSHPFLTGVMIRLIATYVTVKENTAAEQVGVHAGIVMEKDIYSIQAMLIYLMGGFVKLFYCLWSDQQI